MFIIAFNLLSLLTLQIQSFFFVFLMQCHLFILFGVELFLDYAFSGYLVVFGIPVTKFIAAIIVVFLYTIILIMAIIAFRNFLLQAIYYLLVHAYGKTYTGVMWFVSLPKRVIICAVSLLIYVVICFFLSFILIDYSFSQSFIKPVEETELRILEQFHWFSAELAEHDHFRKTFLVSGLCEFNQQIVDYLIQQAEIHNRVCHANSKDDFIQLSQLRAQIVCNYIYQETGNTVTFDYSQAVKYILAYNEEKAKSRKSSFFSKLVALLPHNNDNFI